MNWGLNICNRSASYSKQKPTFHLWSSGLLLIDKTFILEFNFQYYDNFGFQAQNIMIFWDLEIKCLARINSHS